VQKHHITVIAAESKKISHLGLDTKIIDPLAKNYTHGAEEVLVIRIQVTVTVTIYCGLIAITRRALSKLAFSDANIGGCPKYRYVIFCSFWIHDTYEKRLYLKSKIKNKI